MGRDPKAAVNLPSAARFAESVRDTSYLDAGGARVLRHEIIVAAAPVADVWAAFTSAEGWHSWATPYATMSPSTLAFDAELVTSYNPNAAPGDETDIHHRML